MSGRLIDGKVSVVIPAYNEPALPRVVQEVRDEMDRLGRPYEILIIDDASSLDSADEIAQDETVRVYRQPVNRGYGASLKEGILLASGEVVVTFDGDGQHRPSDIGRFLEEMDLGADAVLGARQKHLHSHLWRMPGKWLLKGISQYLSRRKIPDINCGFRAFRTELIRQYLPVCCERFSFSTTSALALLLDDSKVLFLKLDVAGRQGRSTVAPRDGLVALLSVVQVIMMFAPLRVLFPPSLILLSLGTIMLTLDIIRLDITQATILLLSNGLLLFFFGLIGDQIAAVRRRLLLILPEAGPVETDTRLHNGVRGRVEIARAKPVARVDGAPVGDDQGKQPLKLSHEEANVAPPATAPEDDIAAAEPYESDQ